MSHPRVEPTLGESGHAPDSPAPAHLEPVLSAGKPASSGEGMPELVPVQEHAWRPQPLPPLTPPPAPKPQKPPRSGWSIFLWLVVLLLAVVFGPVIALRWLPPPTTAFMLQSETQPVNYAWVPASQIAEVARKAVVASEDQKFWEHQGFDIEAIEKAYEYNQKARHHRRGASTISQQTAKNLFLWSGGGYFRKGIEAMYTVLIEKLWGKNRILEVYLNVVELGPGIYGVEAASQIYFNKHASQLTPEEAARLAAVLPSPRRWNVRKPGPYVQTRIAWVLRQMGYGRAPPEEDSEPPPPPPQDIDPNSPEAADDLPRHGEEPALPPPAAWPSEPERMPDSSSEPAPAADAPAQEAPQQ